MTHSVHLVSQQIAYGVMGDFYNECNTARVSSLHHSPSPHIELTPKTPYLVRDGPDTHKAKSKWINKITLCTLHTIWILKIRFKYLVTFC